MKIAAPASNPFGALSASEISPKTSVKNDPLRLTVLRQIRRQPGEASFFYYDHTFQVETVKVLPGEYFVCNDEILIVTVLGSCIAACLWDSGTQVGGMNHFMLPDGDGSGEFIGRYGSYAMELLINEMLKKGARRETMQAKIFGGAQVLQNFTTLNVGERNTEFVEKYLRIEKIPIVSRDVLDIYSRRVCYFPKTGKALVKRLPVSQGDVLEREERKGNARSVAKKLAGGSIDLF